MWLHFALVKQVWVGEACTSDKQSKRCQSGERMTDEMERQAECLQNVFPAGQVYEFWDCWSFSFLVRGFIRFYACLRFFFPQQSSAIKTHAQKLALELGLQVLFIKHFGPVCLEWESSLNWGNSNNWGIAATGSFVCRKFFCGFVDFKWFGSACGQAHFYRHCPGSRH